MDAHRIGRAIGAMSLGFGLLDIAMGRKFGEGVGAGADKGGLLFRSVGMREVATGLAGLAWPASTVPVWTRFAADLTDIAALGAVAAKPNPRRHMAFAAIAIVAGVAAVDLWAARRIGQQTRSS